MGLNKIKSKDINQNGYNKNSRTPDKIGALFTYPVDFTPDDCLPCDGFVLNIEDYKKLFDVIGNKFNTGTETESEFRIPDFNVTGRFLQPGGNVGTKIEAGLPNHNHSVVAFYWNYPGAAEEGRGAPDYGNHLTLQTTYASVSNPIYGRSSTVQPPAQVVHICIKYK